MGYNLIWIIALIAFVIIEALTYQLLTIWFAVGALGAVVCAVAGFGFNTQIMVFIVVSALTLFILRPISMRHFKVKGEKTNIDSLIGAKVLITEEVNNLSDSGKGKLYGMEWTVRSTDNSVIEKGCIAEVEKIEGVKLMVKKGE